jgi:hypothetical protein
MSLEPKSVVEEVNTNLPRKPRFTLSVLHLPRNVYLLLFFTLGKGFQLANTVFKVIQAGAAPETTCKPSSPA